MIFILALPAEILIPAMIITVLLIALVITMAVRAHREKVSTGEEALIGSEARVLEWNGTRGEVHTWGERWAASSETRLDLKPDDIVYVTGKKKLLLYITNIKP